MRGDRLGLRCGSNNRLWFRLRIGCSSRFGYGNRLGIGHNNRLRRGCSHWFGHDNRFRLGLGRRLQFGTTAHAEHIALIDRSTALGTRRSA